MFSYCENIITMPPYLSSFFQFFRFFSIFFFFYKFSIYDSYEIPALRYEIRFESNGKNWAPYGKIVSTTSTLLPQRMSNCREAQTSWTWYAIYLNLNDLYSYSRDRVAFWHFPSKYIAIIHVHFLLNFTLIYILSRSYA